MEQGLTSHSIQVGRFGDIEQETFTATLMLQVKLASDLIFSPVDSV